MLRILLVIGFLVAAGATVLAVVSEDPLLLRLAVVLALWAALIAAFAVTRSRRDAKAAMLREGEAQVAYQLELQREVSARHEFEADLAAQMVAGQSQQIAELREQLDRLTDVLSSLADGELLVSRLTLSAESARFRSGQSMLSGPEVAQVAAASISTAAQIDHTASIDRAGQRDHVTQPVRVTHAGQVDGGRELLRSAAVAVLEDTAIAPGLVAEPLVDSTAELPVESVVEQAMEPAAERMTEPVLAEVPESAEPAAKPVEEQVAEPVLADASEPVPDVGPQRSPQPATEPAPQPAAEPPVEQEVAWTPPATVPSVTVPQARPAAALRPFRHAAAEPSPSETAGTESDIAQPADETPPASPPPPSSGHHPWRAPGTASYLSAPSVIPETTAPEEATVAASTPAHHAAAEVGPAAPEQAAPAPAALSAGAPDSADEPEAASDHSETVSVDELLAAYGLSGVPRRRRRE
ncbi:MAG: hypothetical protein BGO26_12690 [Actinobacteria bacterium 69-20]|jgi:hypothetical protein|nr:MAG: hypothetical protein BGO26_12690 [Actinobacteria bacterium 69-20]